MRITRLVFAVVLFSSFAICWRIAGQAAEGTPTSAGGQETTKQDETVYEVGPGVSAPHATYAPDPSYTDKARKAKKGGSVILELIVTPGGTTRDVSVIKSLSPDLDKQAVSTIRTWKFEPAKKDGQPVAVQIKVEVTFHIR
jgi:TonB family protein